MPAPHGDPDEHRDAPDEHRGEPDEYRGTPAPHSNDLPVAGGAMTLPGPLGYVADELRANWRDEFWWRNRLLHRVVGPVQGLVYGTDGIDVLAEDWDILLVLDACRVDYFEEVADPDTFDDYRVVTSRASATAEWVNEHFAGREFGDVVYVNSNPHISKNAPGAFHHVYDLWSGETFDEEAHTVFPETVNEWARRADEEYPDKRLIVHYNQPHGPYVGDVPMTWDTDLARGSGEALKKGLVTESEFRAAYRANLEYVLPLARELAGELTGRSVITADHGELFGKRQFPLGVKAYAHPMGLRDPDLVRVPWAVVEDDECRQIEDDGVSEVEYDSAELDERLRDLGYRT